MRKFLLLTILGGLALILSGCSVFFTTQINGDGSGTLGIVYVFPEDTYTCAQAQNEGLIDRDVRWTSGTDSDGDTTCSSNRTFASLSELRQEMNETDIISIRELQISNYVLTYDLDIFPRSQDAGVYTMYWLVHVPGTVLKHNADEVDGNALGWEMEINERNRVFVQSQLPIPPTPTPRPRTGIAGGDSSSDGMLLGLLAIGGVIVVIGGIMFLQRRQQPPRTAATGQYTAPAAGSAPPPSYTTAAPGASVEERLQRLNELHAKGLIGDDEFHARQRAILEDL